MHLLLYRQSPKAIKPIRGNSPERTFSLDLSDECEIMPIFVYQVL